ncbi:ABC1-domain-containing protein [Neoconidiobolus thromboides FSU 785]|nr:ABC1-domain-containing protein [Neoconidiobolus thromboides FSU 785]
MPLTRKLAELYGVSSSVANIARIAINHTLIDLKLKYKTSGLPKFQEEGKWNQAEFKDVGVKFTELDRGFNNSINQMGNNDSLNEKERGLARDLEENEIYPDLGEKQEYIKKQNEENEMRILNEKNEIEKIDNKLNHGIELPNTEEKVTELPKRISETTDDLVVVPKSDLNSVPNSEIKENSPEIKGSDSEILYNRNREYTVETQYQDDSRPKEYLEVNVPTTKFGRFLQYGGLAVSMGSGMLGEAFKRSVGLSKSELGESALWSEGNVKRLVNRLSKMRGAAQKLGQVLAIQDANVLPPQIEKILFQIQHSGAYMPQKQLKRVLSEEIGEDWQNKLMDFEMTPFAAASIGQVHWANIKDSSEQIRSAAVKVQYPGVAQSIDSDLDSLKLLLLASKVLPRGLYLDKTIQVTRMELKWETDYLREAKYAEMFKEALKDSPEYHVPAIYRELTTSNVLTMERLPGVPLNQILDAKQEVRDWIATKIMELCLRELFEFKFMQTDPNWTNFLYDPVDHKIGLLDFGATREFDDAFLSNYLGVLKAAAENDREGCLDYSYRLGYLTGDEHSTMKEAHINSILTLAEPFQVKEDAEYDFSDQTITKRVRDLIPVMLNLRLTPPPEQTYSLHRKLSGAFLLCSRLRAKVKCSQLFYDTIGKFKMEGKL